MKEMLHTDITIVSNTHARDATNCHQNSHAINQLSRHRRQATPILQSEGIVVMDRLNRTRAKQSKSADSLKLKLSICCVIENFASKPT
jgi:hypothetical protein